MAGTYQNKPDPTAGTLGRKDIVISLDLLHELSTEGASKPVNAVEFTWEYDRSSSGISHPSSLRILKNHYNTRISAKPEPQGSSRHRLNIRDVGDSALKELEISSGRKKKTPPVASVMPASASPRSSPSKTVQISQNSTQVTNALKSRRLPVLKTSTCAVHTKRTALVSKSISPRNERYCTTTFGSNGGQLHCQSNRGGSRNAQTNHQAVQPVIQTIRRQAGTHSPILYQSNRDIYPYPNGRIPSLEPPEKTTKSKKFVKTWLQAGGGQTKFSEDLDKKNKLL